MALTLPAPSEIHALREKYFTHSTTTGWILLGYIGPANIAVQESGGGGVEEIVPHLRDDEIQCILLLSSVTYRFDMFVRIPEKDKDVVDRRDGKVITRDIFIMWSGPEVRTIEKGKKQSHQGTVAKLMAPHNAELVAVNKKNLTEASVRDRSNPLSGSHIID